MAAVELDGFERFEFDDGRFVRPVYRRGTGPAVIVIHEMPGLHPLVLTFAERLSQAGMSVWCRHGDYGIDRRGNKRTSG